jgi:glucose-1-phosphate thymidylyltransferase
VVTLTGIVPAAGEGLRLRPFRYPKELLPVALEEVDGGLRPVLAIEHALGALRRGGVHRAIVVVADPKLDLVRLLGTGERLGLDLAYVHQGEAMGLGHAVARCVPWLGGGGGVLVLPDTTFEPEDTVLALSAALADADLALAVFPTDRATELGPVVFGADGAVARVLDKPAPGPDVPANTWGVAAFGPAFGALLSDAVARDPRVVVGAVFDRAVREGLRVRAVPFPAGRYHDLGTTRGLAELLVRRR